MAQRSRDHLKVKFGDGERPSGSDFRDLIDSYLSKEDDEILIDEDRNLDIPAGLNLGDTTEGRTGTLRFHNGHLQFFDGAEWNDVGGEGGAFRLMNANTAVFDGGNVGIGEFQNPPEYKFEVELGNNTQLNQRVKFGNAVISNGQGAAMNSAQFSHSNQGGGNTNFALRQGPSGNLVLNAPLNQPIMIAHNGSSARIFIERNSGEVVIGNAAVLAGAGTAVLQVNGQAFKNQGGAQWAIPSDVSLKKDIREFKDGLKKLMNIRPVRFRYNGKLNTNSEGEEIGVIGQEIAKIFPYMTSYEKTGVKSGQNTEEVDEVLTFNGHALTYVMVNAIQELASMVEDLTTRLKACEEQADQTG